METMNLNATPSPFYVEQINHDHDHDQDQDQHHWPFGPNYQLASSSSSNVTCHIFFGSTQDQTGYHQEEDNNYEYNHGRSSYEIKNKVNNGLKLTLWKKEDPGPAVSEKKKNNSVKWMSSKMRLMKKMKNNSTRKINSTDHHQIKVQQPSSSLETDLSSNTNSPIRVCADCHTTKTPLWRSGPQGPKSLCNACGIRQRKARRAMAAAAASGVVAAATDQPAPAVKTKVQQHKAENMIKTAKTVHFKKRFKTADGKSSNGKEKMGRFEDFLINLSNNLSFHRVFPEEEKDAAILLMALSSGLVHG